MKDLLKTILLDNYKQFTGNIDEKRKSMSKEINLLNEKVANTRDKYLNDKLDEEDLANLYQQGDLQTKRIIGVFKKLNLTVKVFKHLK